MIVGMDNATKLFQAVANDNALAVALSLRQGLSVDLSDSRGNSLLCVACEHNHEIMCEMLINHGADIYHKNTSRETPLIYAVRNGNVNIVRMIIGQLSMLPQDKEYLCDALAHAIVCFEYFIFYMLLDAGADPLLRVKMEKTPYAELLGNTTNLEIMLSQIDYMINKVGINHQSNNGNTFLIETLQSKCWLKYEVVEYLLRYNPNPHLPNAQNKNAMTLAEEWSMQDIAELLHTYAETYQLQ